MIVKVQIPLGAGSLPRDDAPMLVYPATRKPMWSLWPANTDKRLVARIRADCAETGKAYYKARIRANGWPDIGERVEDQPW